MRALAVLFFLMVAVFTLSSAPVEAFELKGFSYYLAVEISGEYADFDEDELLANGWKIKNDDGEILYVHSGADLPIEMLDNNEFKIKLGSEFELSVTRTTRGAYKLSIEYLYGDWDGGVEYAGYMKPDLTEPFVLTELSGGDYASGAWSINVKKFVFHWK